MEQETQKPITVLLADIVPMGNKGEEAIIRGIEDLLLGATKRPVQLGLFDEVDHPRTDGNITSFPLAQIFPFSDLREAEKRWIVINRRGLPACMADVFIRTQNKLATAVCSNREEDQLLREFYEATEILLVGHDGAFSIFSCGFVNFAKNSGKTAGILGTGSLRFSKKNLPRRLLYKRTVAKSDFCFLRERSSYNFLQSIGVSRDRVHLAPDPAFAMEPAAREQVDALLSDKPFYAEVKRSGRKLVAVTVCDHSVAISKSYDKPPAGESRDAFHERIMAEVLDCLVTQEDLHLLFLPHSIGGWSGDDRAVAKRVCVRMPESSRAHTTVLEDDLPARLLKGLVGACDMLIAERLHSAIGAIGMGTPFCMLTNSQDTRVHDILGDMCGCDDLIVDTQNPDASGILKQVRAHVQSLSSLQTVMQDRRDRLRPQLQLLQDELAKVLKPHSGG